MSDIEEIRRELERIGRERERIGRELERRPRRAWPNGEAHREAVREAVRRAVESCVLLSRIEDTMRDIGRERFLEEYATSVPDLAKLITLCEEDAREAGPLMEKDAEWMGNRIRKLLI